MLISLVTYLLGFLVIAIILGREIKAIEFSETSEIVKSMLLVTAVALLWPVFGVWILWEAIDIYRICNKNQVRKGSYEHRQG